MATIEQRMDEQLSRKVPIYLIDRVIGHGGYASDAITLSYLDRMYAGGTLLLVLRHEGVHVLDHKIAESRPTFMAEGFAVYVAGGHFKDEPIRPRAAALMTLNRYVPLRELIDTFYPTQHEVGYLEAAGFIDYLVDTYGWERFKSFYGDFQPGDGGDADQVAAALQRQFDMTLEQAEQGYRAYLQGTDPGDQVRDLDDTLRFYDTVRRYQQVLDPTAYFLYAWLPDFSTARERGIVADAMRHPHAPINVALETMLVAADAALREGHYATQEELVSTVNTILDTGMAYNTR
jgi:hypothetical protein